MYELILTAEKMIMCIFKAKLLVEFRKYRLGA